MILDISFNWKFFGLFFLTLYLFYLRHSLVIKYLLAITVNLLLYLT